VSAPRAPSAKSPLAGIIVEDQDRHDQPRSAPRVEAEPNPRTGASRPYRHSKCGLKVVRFDAAGESAHDVVRRRRGLTRGCPEYGPAGAPQGSARVNRHS